MPNDIVQLKHRVFYTSELGLRALNQGKLPCSYTSLANMPGFPHTVHVLAPEPAKVAKAFTADGLRDHLSAVNISQYQADSLVYRIFGEGA